MGLNAKASTGGSWLGAFEIVVKNHIAIADIIAIGIAL
jgi:hypothetical protein